MKLETFFIYSALAFLLIAIIAGAGFLTSAALNFVLPLFWDSAPKLTMWHGIAINFIFAMIGKGK